MSKEFKENGFVVVKNFFSKELINIATEYFKLKYQVSKFKKEYKSSIDYDVSSSYVYYGDALCESILLSYGKKISTFLGLTLSPTYAFARIYEKGDLLIPHVDRKSCEISVTCPIFISDDKPSVINVSNYTNKFYPGEDQLTYDKAKNNQFTKIELYPGDVLFYKGCEHYHWRDPLSSPFLFQFFMHAVQTDGKYAEYVYDTRPIMGLPTSYRLIND